MSSLFRTKSVADIQANLDDAAASHGGGLKRTLSAFDLVMLGIGAVIGAGIFSTLGTAAVGEPGVRLGAGPALVLSFVLLGVVCALAGLCYAELTAMIPIAGSAYTYAYATLGELVAWIIGWDLILEYALATATVAVGWSRYFGRGLEIIGLELPETLMKAPADGGLVNLPAVLVVMLLSILLAVGVKESARFNSGIVFIKLFTLAVFIGVAAGKVEPANWTPFMPFGWDGVMTGAAVIFFAYIGFDAISTAAEETKDPQRNLPIGILGGLAICTVIYVIVGVVLTGMVPYKELAVADPLARALEMAGFKTVGWFVALGAAVSMSAVLLVFQYGQPRIFFAMARDGLLPKWAAHLNPVTRIPSTTTIITGVFVASWALVGDAAETYDLTNIGTLFAFMLVSIGVLVLRYLEPERPRPFRVPFVWPVCLL
ncbi:MAG: amino acid permease, partial [bacterium]